METSKFTSSLVILILEIKIEMGTISFHKIICLNWKFKTFWWKFLQSWKRCLHFYSLTLVGKWHLKVATVCNFLKSIQKLVFKFISRICNLPLWKKLRSKISLQFLHYHKTAFKFFDGIDFRLWKLRSCAFRIWQLIFALSPLFVLT